MERKEIKIRNKNIQKRIYSEREREREREMEVIRREAGFVKEEEDPKGLNFQEGMGVNGK